MDKKLTLYYFPGSYFSQKILVALYEKRLTFDEVLVNIRSGENRKEWFMKVNPKCEVPALKHGDEVISDSERIIDYIDKAFPQELKLVPEVTSSNGQEVQEIRTMLNGIKIDHITYGLFANESVRVGKLKAPKIFLSTVSKKALTKEYGDAIKELNDSSLRNPEAASDIRWKIKDLEDKRDVVLNEDKVAATLDSIEPIFDKLEQYLEKTKAESGSTEEFWLTGKDFTAADVSTSILLYRMWLIGLDERYFTGAKRPLLYQYYIRVQKRPAFQKMAQKFNGVSLFGMALKAHAGTVAIMVVKVGVMIGLVGVAVYAIRELRKK